MAEPIEQDGELYFPTGEVRRVRQDELYLCTDGTIERAVINSCEVEYPIYHKLDRATVSFVLDSEVGGLSLRSKLIEESRFGYREWADEMLAHLEKLEGKS